MNTSAVDQVLASGEGVSPRLAALPESQWFERKSGRVKARDLANALVGMANAEGGDIVIGLHDGQLDAPSHKQKNALRQAAHDFTSPTVRARVEEVEVGLEETLLVIRVVPGDVVHETSGGDCYLRVGDETKKLGYAQRQELEFDRGAAPFDGTPIALSRDVLDESESQAYAEVIGSSSADRMLRARNLLTNDGRLTVASYLLFAEHPQTLFPNAYVRVLRYTGTQRGEGATLTLDDAGDIRCEGSLPRQITEAAQVIDQMMPRRRTLGADGRFAGQPLVPRDAWLEGLVNAVVHRSYSMAGDHVRVEIFPDRVEISSPGRFPGLVDPRNLLDVSRHARNPRIARVCSDLGITQELGEGIRRIYSVVRARGLVDPIYTQTQAGVRLMLSAADAIPTDILDALPRGARSVLDALRAAGRPLGTGQIEELVGVARPTAVRYLRALRDSGVVVWDGQSPRDPRATWTIA